jgi:hypothetical protein
MSVLDAAEAVLRDSGEALEFGLVRTFDKTPEATLYPQVIQEI